MNKNIQFGAYDIQGKELPFEFRVEEKQDAVGTHLKFSVKNSAKNPVEVALFKLLEWDSAKKALHVYKPGFNKPSDDCFFYTPEVGKPHPECNTWISDCLMRFSETSLYFSTMSAMQVSDENWVLWGFSTFEAYHGVIEFDHKEKSVIAHAWMEGDESLFDPDVWVELEELVIIEGAFVHAVDTYCKYLTDLHGCRKPGAYTGWSDWEFFRVPGKNEKETVASSVAMGDLIEKGWPLDSVVVDAGWCENVYRYDTPDPRFPHGAEWLCKQISDHHGTPGLWIAPWLMTEAAPICREHPEWFAIDKTTNDVHKKYRSDGQVIITFDFSVPEAVEWFRGQLRMMREWGYRYFKLDGPVVIHYMNTRFHDPHSTRFKQITQIMRLVREELGDDILIESEGVYGPAIGIADFHRITQDQHPRWYNPNGEPILRVNIPTTLCGAIWNNRFWSNINMMVLRDAPTPNYEFYPEQPNLREILLTQTELEAYLTAMWFSCSAMFFSAPLPMTMKSPYYAEYFRRVLPLGKDLLTNPVDVEKNEPTIFESTCNGKRFIHVYNFDETYRDETKVNLGGKYHVYDYWHEEYIGILDGEMTVRDLAPRSCRLYWLTPVEADYQIVGATANIAQIGISMKENARGELEITAPTFAKTEQKVTITVPNNYALVSEDKDNVLCDNRKNGLAVISFIAKEQPVVLKKTMKK